MEEDIEKLDEKHRKYFDFVKDHIPYRGIWGPNSEEMEELARLRREYFEVMEKCGPSRSLYELKRDRIIMFGNGFGGSGEDLETAHNRLILENVQMVSDGLKIFVKKERSGDIASHTIRSVDKELLGRIQGILEKDWTGKGKTISEVYSAKII